MIAIVAFVACAPAPALSSEEEDLPTLPPSDALAPELDPSVLDALVADAFASDLVFPSAIGTWMRDLVTDALAGSDVQCPDMTTTEGDETTTDTFFFGDCTGARYRVHGLYLYEERSGDTDGAHAWNGSISSFIGTNLATGEPIASGGAWSDSWRATPDGVVSFDSAWEGGYRDGSGVGTLGAGISGSFDFVGAFIPNRGIEAQIDATMHIGDHDVALTGVTVSPDCPDVATGEIMLRDPGTGWWTLDLPEDCTGCGEWSWYGEPEGESCAGATIAEALTDAIAARVAELP